ncbi:VPLPA-CTERM sorting domain-containing protein [Oceanicoccus sagamiensis]|uniref:Uncharacterized protein n=1 Tax=Oceanicoccus sagamiensis TaxID=716816 RepID=A0A1X9N5C2_9GAMM|nr:VPLPA-CTERM sorting domain-containing protein [Oceanicoccus sagamiensis]ARN73310.1 hypothetical protein BST96_03835 [Oceanicoccus sagamiensis]
MLKQTLALAGLALSLSANSAIVDSDMDGLLDNDEINIFGTDPHSADTDGGLVIDGGEVSLGTDPLDPGDEPSSQFLPLSISILGGPFEIAMGDSLTVTAEASGQLGVFTFWDIDTSDNNFYDAYTLTTTVDWESLAPFLVNTGDTKQIHFSATDFYGNQASTSAVVTLVGITAPEVPIPAAAWLFGSALLGLAGIKRKK